MYTDNTVRTKERDQGNGFTNLGDVNPFRWNRDVQENYFIQLLK